MVSELFDGKTWRAATGVDFTDITYHRAVAVAAVRVAFNRPEVRNAFGPQTLDELYRALKVVPHAQLARSALCWAERICGKSPTAQRMLKFAFNLMDTGWRGSSSSREATRLAYGTEEAREGRNAFVVGPPRRKPSRSMAPSSVCAMSRSRPRGLLSKDACEWGTLELLTRGASERHVSRGHRRTVLHSPDSDSNDEARK